MSHFTTIKTRFISRDFLEKALKDLGLTVETGDLTIRGYLGQKTPVEVRVPTSNPGFQIGFRKLGSEYDMVADWYGIRDRQPGPFLEAVSRRYAYHAVIAALESRDFSTVKQEESSDGSIHLVFRRQTA